NMARPSISIFSELSKSPAASALASSLADQVTNNRRRFAIHFFYVCVCVRMRAYACVGVQICFAQTAGHPPSLRLQPSLAELSRTSRRGKGGGRFFDRMVPWRPG